MALEVVEVDLEEGKEGQSVSVILPRRGMSETHIAAREGVVLVAGNDLGVPVHTRYWSLFTVALVLGHFEDSHLFAGSPLRLKDDRSSQLLLLTGICTSDVTMLTCFRAMMPSWTSPLSYRSLRTGLGISLPMAVDCHAATTATKKVWDFMVR